MTETTGTTTTIYSGNYIYQNNVLQMISQPEGYIEPNFTSSGVLTSSEVEMDYVYQYKDHLGNIRLTYKDDQLYDTDFNNGSYSPWTKSENTTSMTIEGDRLKVITGVHLNGANGYYNLLAGETYEIAVDIDRSLFTTDLEFSLWNGNSKIYGEYVTTSKTVKMNYTPTISATYRINLRLRDYGYAGGPQTFYLDNVIIRKTALAIIEENNYYPFGLKHQGYNDDYSPNRNAVATKFKYNSKELNDELGLDLYDYGARMYDPALGRWNVPDPLSQFHSPYNYAANNPISMIDPSGMWAYGTTYTNGSDGFNEIIEEFGIGSNSTSSSEDNEGETTEDPQEKPKSKESKKGEASSSNTKAYAISENPNDGTYEFGRNKGSIQDFVDYYKGWNIVDIRKDIKSGEGNGIHFVYDPNSGKYIDMKHMLIAGRYGNSGGLIWETIQLKTAFGSAFNDQDLFSNNLGERFYLQYINNIYNDPCKFAEYVGEFLEQSTLLRYSPIPIQRLKSIIE